MTAVKPPLSSRRQLAGPWHSGWQVIRPQLYLKASDGQIRDQDETAETARPVRRRPRAAQICRPQVRWPQSRGTQGAQSAQARRAGQIARRQRRERLHRQAHRGAGGARARPPPPRHVYRRHRREGAASSVRGSDRQFHGRGARRPRHLDRGGDGGERLRLRHRQRPRHSGRSASEIQEQVGAGSHHVHAARRRQIRFEGLRDIGRPARRRRLGRQCAVRPHGGGSRARADALQDGFRARQAEGQVGQGRPRAQPARHQDTLPSRSGHLRAEGGVQGGARVQDGALQGLSLRRRRDPLALRQGAAQGRRGRAGEGDLPFRRRPEGLSRRQSGRRHSGASRHLHRLLGQDRRAWRGRMGGRLDGGRRRFRAILLQHHSDAGRRHA